MTSSNPDGMIHSENMCSQAVVERILGDESVTSIKIFNTIQSDNFSSGSSGWQIRRDTGSAEFQDITARGSITATSGELQTLSVTGTLTLTGSALIKSSNYVAATSGWQIEADGDAEFNDVTIRGTIYATAGEIGGLSITGNLTMGTGGVFRTASSGERIEITEAELDRITFYSGLANEDDPGTMLVASRSSHPLLQINGPQNVGDFPAYLELASAGAGGSDWNALLLSVEGPTRLEGWTGGVTIYGGNAGSGSSICATFYDGQIRAVDGTATDPAYSFDDDDDSGMYRLTANQVGIAAAGNRIVSIGQSFLIVSAGSLDDDDPRLNANGTVSSPAYTFRGDTNTGFYRSSADQVSISTGGTSRGYWNNNGWHILTISTTGSAANMHYFTTDNRIYRSTSARKYKEHINYDVRETLANIQLQPAHFYRPDDDRWYFDFIADDLAEQNPLLGVYDENGDIENYEKPGALAVLAAKVNRLEELMLNAG